MGGEVGPVEPGRLPESADGPASRCGGRLPWHATCFTGGAGWDGPKGPVRAESPAQESCVLRECTTCTTPLHESLDYCPNCGDAVGMDDGTDVQALVGNTVAGKFLVQKYIGRGAMGRVYGALHLSLGKSVCIKVMHPRHMADPTARKRFRQEAKTASRLHHPNCINILDFGSMSDGTLFIVMDFIEGRNLSEVLRREQILDQKRVLRIADQVCSALEEAHSHGIIHRDLKPANVMLDDKNRQTDLVTVLDFGIAKIGASKEAVDLTAADLTESGNICGTVTYMSPEQVKGESLDGRSDFYSLGVVMYELCTGEPPFRSDSIVETANMHLSEMPMSPSLLLPHLSPAVESLILALMAKDRDDRPASPFEVKELIRKAAGALSPNHAPAGAPGPATRPDVPVVTLEALERARSKPQE